MVRRFSLRFRAVLCAAIAIAALVPVISVSLPVPPVSALGDGSVVISVWTCPDGLDPNSADSARFADACTTPASNLTFVLTVKNGDTPLTRKTDYPKPGAGSVKWTAPFTDVVTIKLSDAPKDLRSVVFCDDGAGSEKQNVADGVTLKTDYRVSEDGLDCQWYFLPVPKPTATPTRVPPTATFTATPTLTFTNTPVPPTATSTATPTSTPVPPTATPTPSNTPLPPTRALPTATNTEEATPADTPTAETTPTTAPTPKLIKGPLRIRALDILEGANYSQAEAINDAGIVVGASGLYSDGAKQWQSAARWVDGGKTMQELNGLPGSVINEAADINNNGLIVGSSALADGTKHAVLWVEDTPQDLGTLGAGTLSEAVAINDAGQVIGISTTEPDQTLRGDGTHGFIWDRGEMTDLGVLDGATRSLALDINASGVIVGLSGSEAVYWGTDRQIVDLGVPGYATSINNAGWATGGFLGDDKLVHGFIIDTNQEDSQRTDLGTLKSNNGFVVRMNDGAAAVGRGCDTFDCSGSEQLALLWQNGRVYDLQKLLSDANAERWTLQGAFDINSRGDVVGAGIYGVNRDNGGRTQGYLLYAGADTSVIPDFSVPAATPSPTPKPNAKPPREFSYQDEYYLTDRVVPLRKSDLVEVTAYRSFIVYARTADAPYSALYIPVSKRAADGYIRYVPEQTTHPQDACPAEDPRIAIPSPWTLSDGSVYVFAGYEPDVSGSLMTELAPNVFYETGSSLPLKELLFKAPDGYQRYQLLNESQVGLVDQLSAGFAFSGQQFAYRETLADATGLGRLTRIGCAGPFKVSAVFGEDTPPFGKIYVEVGGRILVFNAVAQKSGDTGDTLYAIAPGAFVRSSATGGGTVFALTSGMPVLAVGSFRLRRPRRRARDHRNVV